MVCLWMNSPLEKVVHHENDFGNDMIGAIKISNIGLYNHGNGMLLPFEKIH